MSIEHRWTSRESVRTSVSIACPRLGLVRGRLRNISHGGALVELGTPLPPNVPVELIVRTPIGPRMHSHRLPAVVTRSGDRGVGLMFGRIDAETWAAVLTHLKPEQTLKEARATAHEILVTSRSG